MKKLIIFLCFSSLSFANDTDHLKVKKGFRVQFFSDDVPNARSMVLSPSGTLFVGTRTEGKVYALKDTNNDGKADLKWIIASDLNMPNGVAFKNGSLFVAEVHRVIRFDDIENNLSKPKKPVQVGADFPKIRHHGWKYIAIGPDDKLYIPVGAPCNICDHEDKRFATIMRMDLDGKNLEVYAKGIRNTVGFDWHPQTGKLWFSDNGRDWLGDDLPNEEVNMIEKKGQHFGYPFVHSDQTQDPEFWDKRGKSFSWEKPKVKMQAHTAPLGIHFYQGGMFPKEYKTKLFIAQHGSWNRTSKVGYKVAMVTVTGDKADSFEDFLTGFLTDSKKVLGRPVDIIEDQKGALLISDDKKGAIYRVISDQ